MAKSITRRKALFSLMAGAGAIGAYGALGRRIDRRPRGIAHAAGAQPKFLIVVGATGGASMIDAFLAIRAGESRNAGGINTFPDAQVASVAGTPFRAVDLRGAGFNILGTPVQSNQIPFVQAHSQDMMVVSVEHTSVNHTIAQKRSITGNGAWLGRTLQEAVAAQYGADCPIPNANMGSFGFLEPGTDDSLPPEAFPESIADPTRFALGLDSARGIPDAPSKQVLDLARAKRDKNLDPQSIFYRTFYKNRRIQRWMSHRGATNEQIQTLDLISKLNLMPNRPPLFPLDQYGLEESPDGQRLLASFPRLLEDPLEAQAALAYLLIKNGVSVSVTISPTFDPVANDEGGLTIISPPLAFDNSHGEHRATQGFMWQRTLTVIDKLICLLKGDECGPGTGTSYWDNTCIYVATDFGRSKVRRDPGSLGFGTGHHLNNGLLVVSPMCNGNTVLGGVDADTGLTHGFDISSGAPITGSPAATEAQFYGGLLQLMDVDTSGSGLPDVPAMRR